MTTFRRWFRLTAILVFLLAYLEISKCSAGGSCKCGECEISGMSIPESFLANRCPDVIMLRLQNRNITSVDRHAFNGLDSLTYLYLENNQVRTLDENQFFNNVVLKILNVNGNPLKQMRIRSGSLELLSAEGCNLSNDQSTFEHLPALKVLLLRRNAMTTFLRNLPPSLEKLDLSYNLLEELNQDSLQSLPSLRELLLDGNRLTLLRPESTSLTSLSIRDCHLSLESLCLAYLPNLTKLEARGNNLTRVSPRPHRLNLSNDVLNPLETDLGLINQQLDVSFTKRCSNDSQRQVKVARTMKVLDLASVTLATLFFLVAASFIGTVLFWHCVRRRPGRTYNEKLRGLWRNSDTTYLVPTVHADKVEEHTYIEVI